MLTSDTKWRYLFCFFPKKMELVQLRDSRRSSSRWLVNRESADWFLHNNQLEMLLTTPNNKCWQVKIGISLSNQEIRRKNTCLSIFRFNRQCYKEDSWKRNSRELHTIAEQSWTAFKMVRHSKQLTSWAYLLTQNIMIWEM